MRSSVCPATALTSIDNNDFAIYIFIFRVIWSLVAEEMNCTPKPQDLQIPKTLKSKTSKVQHPQIPQNLQTPNSKTP